VLLGYNRYSWPLAANAFGDTERRIKTVQHGIGASEHRALLAAQQRAGRWVMTGPTAVGHVETRLLE
jgi:hypothetical protein